MNLPAFSSAQRCHCNNTLSASGNSLAFFSEFRHTVVADENPVGPYGEVDMLPMDIMDENQLDEVLSRPGPGLRWDLEKIGGDFLVLGAGGKIGPSLCRMLKRAAPDRRVTAVSRFSNPEAVAKLEQAGVEVRRGDLFDRDFLASLPDCANVVFMAGQKFGTTGKEPETWAENVYLPALAAERFRRSRFVVFSTGNVYPFWPAEGPGPNEEDPPDPVGEYAQSCLGRERIFQYFSERFGTPVLLFRLNYACELRYGVLVDIAQKVRAGEPVDLSMGRVNVIWQGTAVEMALRSFALARSPAAILNCAGPAYSVRSLAERFGRLFGVRVFFKGSEAPTALLSDGRKAMRVFGTGPVDIEVLCGWIARWIDRGGVVWGKPTHFEVRNGKF